jgi:hypothetical protein
MRKVRMALAALTGVTLSLGGFASAAHADPPGDNGTIKIDAEAFDTAPNNEPHVGCLFQVDFYGFDQGDLNAAVEFAVHPPTGQDVVLKTDTVFIGEDAAGGGTDLDAERTYNLSSALTAFDAHPQQGYHVKLTIHADGSQGADTKYKVFWVQSCATSPS